MSWLMLEVINDFSEVRSGALFMVTAIQIVTILFTLGITVVGIYLVVLLVKFLKRGIKYYDIKLENMEKDKEE